MTLLVAVLLASQGLAPLRKSDLVRLLSGSAMTQQEIAELVRRNCLTFDATERDRQDLRRLGAEAVLLSAVDGCARREAARAAPRPPAPPPSAARVAPPRPQSRPPPVPSATSPPVIRIAAERSGFVAGAGQRGPAGTRLPRALVFEARDSAGSPVVGQTVELVAVNARVEPTTAVTDAAGRVQVGVTLGQRVGFATVIVAVGVIEKQAAFAVAVGPAAQLVVACRGATLAGRAVLRPDTVVGLRVTAQDAYANAAPLTGLRAAVADARIFRVLRIAEDSGGGEGTVTLKPDQPGTTSLAVIANGLRQYLTLTVLPRGAREPADCP
ncbi:MAG TPA: Ig-like domain-containing protein [Gemmatimonadales bacterium]|nr:Ig-like domain-containing protein [Gemmatimonadales bacterium]